MSNASDFIIENGVLKKYGPGGDVIVPNGVTTIGKEVFSNRNDIKSIIVPQGVTHIEYGAFSYCKNLERVVLPEGITNIQDRIFSNCTSLVDVVLPDSLEDIGRGAFVRCISLKHVKLPKNLKVMSATFENCHSLEKIEIPDSVTKMEEDLFWNCKSLKEIVFGKNTPNFEFQADFLLGCKQLEKIVIPEDNEYFEMRDTVLFTKNGKEIAYCLPTFSGEYIIPDGVKIIRQSAFQHCDKITNVVIPNSVRVIKSKAFAGCKSITTLCIPASVEKIGECAFDRSYAAGCDAPELEPYKSISVGICDRKSIGYRIFDFPAGNTPLVYSELPLSLVRYDDEKRRLAMGFCLNSELYKDEYAKEYQTYVKEQKKWILEYARKMYEYGVEEYYKKLEETDGTNGKKKKESKPLPQIDFGECTSMEDLECDRHALVKYKGSANRVVIPSHIKYIKPDAFFQNNTVEEIVILGVEGSLLERTFSECKKLKRVILASGVTQIEKKCFVKCPKLERVTILSPTMKFKQDLYKVKARLNIVAPEMSPASIKEMYRPKVIKSFAVAYVEGSIYKPSADSKMITYLKRQSHQMYQLFDDIPELMNVMMDYSLITVQEAQILYTQYEEISSSKAKLLRNYLESKGKKGNAQTKKENSVAEMKKDWVYQEYTYENEGTTIKAIKITKYKGFVGNVVIPNSIGGITVDRIDMAAFNGNKFIVSVIIPESIKSVGAAAFGCCSALQKVEVKGKDVSFGTACFGSCTSLTEFIADYDAISWGIHMFQFCHKLISPEGFVILGPENRKRLVDVSLPITSSEVRIPDGVVIINDYAFAEYYGGEFSDGSYTKKLQRVIVPESVEIIGACAFFECANLRKINIPTSVKTIMTGAFLSCDSLRNISISESVTELQPRIFGGQPKYDINIVGKKGGNVERYVENYNAEILRNSDRKINFISAETRQVEEEPLNDFDVVDGTLVKYWGHECKITIPANVVRIGSNAFMDNTTIREVTITENTKIIDEFSFFNATKLHKLDIEEGVEVISDTAFAYTGLEEVTIPGTVKEIGSDAFSSCKHLKKIVIKQGVKKIGERAFAFCNNLETVEIPDSVVEIEKDAFDHCSNMRNITLPSYITSSDVAKDIRRYIGLPYQLINI